MKFVKMQGIGNDYVYVNLVPGFDTSEPAVYDENGTLVSIDSRPVGELAVSVSDRHFGIGSDGLIAIAPSKTADVRMIMFNADGSEGAMCGNGIRCVAKYAYDHHIVETPEIRVETASGIKTLELSIESGVCTYVRVDMGKPIFLPEKIPVEIREFGPARDAGQVPSDAIVRRKLNVCDRDYEVTCVSMGNPHCVIFTEGICDLELEKLGPFFEHHKAFPKQVNTEFVEVIDDHTLRMRVWERGSGETLACGTGSCAVVVAAVLNGYVRRGEEIEVILTGGSLFDTWTESGEVLMKGPASTVFEGRWMGADHDRR